MSEACRPAGQCALSQLVVLVVEDDDDARALLCELLAERGAFVLSARNGVEARRRAHGLVDLIITDISMPDEDGIAMMRQLRGRRAVTPAIAVTGRIAPEQLQRGVPGLFAAAFSKPYDLAELLETALRLTGSAPRFDDEVTRRLRPPDDSK